MKLQLGLVLSLGLVTWTWHKCFHFWPVVSFLFSNSYTFYFITLSFFSLNLDHLFQCLAHTTLLCFTGDVNAFHFSIILGYSDAGCSRSL